MNNNIIPFIVENALNSSYIDSLFVSLFFKPSYIQDILSEYPENISFIYLQELIYENFVCNMRRNFFIDSATINEIRNYMTLCGWKNTSDTIDTYDVQDLYSFLINGFHKSKLNFTKIGRCAPSSASSPSLPINLSSISVHGGCATRSRSLANEADERSDLIKLNYIELKVTKNSDIKTMLDEYFDEKISQYHFEEVPNFIPIYLNRNFETTNVNKLNNFSIDIKQGIYISKNNINQEQKTLLWTIHSIVCYSSGHYYSIVSNETGWYLFSHFKLPSLLKIDIKNEDMAAKIKQECVFVVYTKH